MNKKIKALMKASNQMQNAWYEVHMNSEGEHKDTFIKIRREIHELETRMMDLVEQMQEEQKEMEE